MNVSVIISTYNRPHYLEKTLQGYLHQSISPDEIIIADDGSTAQTAEMVKKIADSSPIPIKHVWHEDKGFRAAAIRNKAIAKSSGDYIILSDDDSVPCSEMVKDHKDFAQKGFFIQGHRVLLMKDAVDTFSFKFANTRGAFRLMLKGLAKNVSNSLRLPLPLIRKTKSLRGIRSCNMSFFKSDFLAVNGFNEDFVGWGKEDSELVVRFYKLGLMRKDVKFRLCCYHLWHEEFSRDRLKQNIALLEDAMSQEGYYCTNGVDKYLK